MKMHRDDWQALRKPVLIFSVVVFVAMLFIGLAYQYEYRQTVELQQVKANFNEVQQQLQLAQQQAEDRLQYLPQYQHLVDTGFIGEERRQQWLERLLQVHEQYGLFEIDYDIGQQQAYQPDFVADMMDEVGNSRLYRSVMTLRLNLLHEGELLHLLSGLSQHTSPFIARDCEILRVIDTDAVGELQPNLKAQCVIDWLTLKDPMLKERD